MIGDCFGNFITQRRGLAGYTKTAVGHAAPGASGDLCQLIWGQRAHAPTIKLAQRRKRYVIDIQIQPHPDGICCHQKIDIAVLIQFDLRVTRTRRKRTHHHGSAAFLPANQLCNRVDVFN